MMAPVAFVSLCGISFMNGQGIHHSSEAPEYLRLCIQFVVMLNILSMALALIAAAQRARAIRNSMWPFTPAWAGLMFPLVTNCEVAVMMEQFFAPCAMP